MLFHSVAPLGCKKTNPKLHLFRFYFRSQLQHPERTTKVNRLPPESWTASTLRSGAAQAGGSAEDWDPGAQRASRAAAVRDQRGHSGSSSGSQGWPAARPHQERPWWQSGPEPAEQGRGSGSGRCLAPGELVRGEERVPLTEAPHSWLSPTWVRPTATHLHSSRAALLHRQLPRDLPSHLVLAERERGRLSSLFHLRTCKSKKS